MSIEKITLRISTTTDLFDGTNEQDRAGLDLDASAATFDQVLAARVVQQFPGVPVERGAQTRALARGTSAYTYMEESEVEETIRAISEELFNDGNLWMIEQ